MQSNLFIENIELVLNNIRFLQHVTEYEHEYHHSNLLVSKTTDNFSGRQHTKNTQGHHGNQKGEGYSQQIPIQRDQDFRRAVCRQGQARRASGAEVLR